MGQELTDGGIAVRALQHLFYSLEAERGAEILATPWWS